MKDSFFDCGFDVEGDREFFLFLGVGISSQNEVYFFLFLFILEEFHLDILEIERSDSMTESENGFGVFLGEDLVLESQFRMLRFTSGPFGRGFESKRTRTGLAGELSFS